MSVEARHSPPLHRPGDVTTRPKGILKNPSFSGPHSGSPEKDNPLAQVPSGTVDPQEAKEITYQNTIQNAGPRRSSSAAGRRSSNSRRHSSIAGGGSEDNADNPRLKWDEANLYLAEQEAGGRMKITEPKTPFEYGNNAMDEDEDDVGIDPRYVSVDEVDLAKKGSSAQNPKRSMKENDIPGLELGDPEDETAGAGMEDDRIERMEGLNREGSREKHVNMGAAGTGGVEGVGMPTEEEQEKHAQFEAQRRKHYEMKNVKGMLGHPEDIDDDDEDDTKRSGLNGSR